MFFGCWSKVIRSILRSSDRPSRNIDHRGTSTVSFPVIYVRGCHRRPVHSKPKGPATDKLMLMPTEAPKVSPSVFAPTKENYFRPRAPWINPDIQWNATKVLNLARSSLSKSRTWKRLLDPVLSWANLFSSRFERGLDPRSTWERRITGAMSDRPWILPTISHGL